MGRNTDGRAFSVPVGTRLAWATVALVLSLLLFSALLLFSVLCFFLLWQFLVVL